MAPPYRTLFTVQAVGICYANFEGNQKLPFFVKMIHLLLILNETTRGSVLIFFSTDYSSSKDR